MELNQNFAANSVVYDKACDLVENKVTQSYFSKTSIDGKKGFKATYWNNRDRSGNVVTTDQIANPLKLTTAGDHEFASGVKLVGFSAQYETEFEAPETEEIVFKVGATGHFELLVNGKHLQDLITGVHFLQEFLIKLKKVRNTKLKSGMHS